MTLSIKHPFTSAKTDSGDVTLIQPSNWNAGHSIALTGPALIGKSTSGAGSAIEITLGANLAFVGNALTATGGSNGNSTPAVLSQTDTVMPVDASLSSNFKATLTDDRTLENPSNLSEGMTINFAFTQDGTGSRLLSFDTLYTFPGGLNSKISTEASAKDLMICYYDGVDLLCTLSKAFAVPMAFIEGMLDFSAPENSGLLATI
jgi:hypothetical protein